LIPAGKIRCYLTGILRNDTPDPEENVRQGAARTLVEGYGYPREDIETELRIYEPVAKPLSRVG